MTAPVPTADTPSVAGSAPSGAAPRGTRIAHLGIAVRGLAENLSFYRDVLGLPEVPLDDADGARIAGLAAGESLVELLEPADAASPPTGGS